MATVFSVIKSSIFVSSIVPSDIFTSQKTGCSLFLTIACVVETNVNGVVITSAPSGKLNDCIAISSAMCPFTISDNSGTSKYCFSFSSNSL